MSKGIDWVAIHNEYITTQISYRKLCKKYGISFITLQQRATREKWVEEKGKTHIKLMSKTCQKTVEKVARAGANKLAKEFRAANMISDIINKALKDPDQFCKHLVQRREKTDLSESAWVAEELFTVVDTKRLKDLASALEIVEGAKRRIKGILTEVDKQRLEINREVLAITKAKAGVGDNDKDNETGIVMMPTVDLKTYEAEKAAELERLKAEKEAAKDDK